MCFLEGFGPPGGNPQRGLKGRPNASKKGLHLSIKTKIKIHVGHRLEIHVGHELEYGPCLLWCTSDAIFFYEKI